MDGLLIEGTNLRIVGLAVSWANRDSYYVALTERNIPGEEHIPASWCSGFPKRCDEAGIKLAHKIIG